MVNELCSANYMQCILHNMKTKQPINTVCQLEIKLDDMTYDTDMLATSLVASIKTRLIVVVGRQKH